MSPIKEDLINAIISASQANLLGMKKDLENSYSDAHDQEALNWIKNNAAAYRSHFGTRLEPLSPYELGEILKQLTYSTKNLSDIIKDGEFFPPLKEQKTSH
ncbi:MAG: hypothetical protein VYC17_01405 [Nitrospinota bacterium]|nr:hypothetical protein [Nitrospinota bacterium]